MWIVMALQKEVLGIIFLVAGLAAIIIWTTFSYDRGLILLASIFGLIGA